MEKKSKAAVYIRKLPLYPPDEILGIYHEAKWIKLDELLEKCKADTDILIIPCPEVLGDDYLELVVNLSKIAKAGLKLAIAKPSHTIKVKDTLNLPD